MCWSFLLIKYKVTGLKVCNFIKKRLQHKCFPVNIVKFLTPLVATSVNIFSIYGKGKETVQDNAILNPLVSGVH